MHKYIYNQINIFINQAEKIAQIDLQALLENYGANAEKSLNKCHETDRKYISKDNDTYESYGCEIITPSDTGDRWSSVNVLWINPGDSLFIKSKEENFSNKKEILQKELLRLKKEFYSLFKNRYKELQNKEISDEKLENLDILKIFNNERQFSIVDYLITDIQKINEINEFINNFKIPYELESILNNEYVDNSIKNILKHSFIIFKRFKFIQLVNSFASKKNYKKIITSDNLKLPYSEYKKGLGNVGKYKDTLIQDLNKGDFPLDNESSSKFFIKSYCETDFIKKNSTYRDYLSDCYSILGSVTNLTISEAEIKKNVQRFGLYFASGLLLLLPDPSTVSKTAAIAILAADAAVSAGYVVLAYNKYLTQKQLREYNLSFINSKTAEEVGLKFIPQGEINLAKLDIALDSLGFVTSVGKLGLDTVRLYKPGYSIVLKLSKSFLKKKYASKLNKLLAEDAVIRTGLNADKLLEGLRAKPIDFHFKTLKEMLLQIPVAAWHAGIDLDSYLKLIIKSQKSIPGVKGMGHSFSYDSVREIESLIKNKNISLDDFRKFIPKNQSNQFSPNPTDILFGYKYYKIDTRKGFIYEFKIHSPQLKARDWPESSSGWIWTAQIARKKIPNELDTSSSSLLDFIQNKASNDFFKKNRDYSLLDWNGKFIPVKFPNETTHIPLLFN